MTFTVTEAAHVLGIGRTLAYELARRYRETGGTEGLPVILIGSCLKVPCWALFEFARTGRVVSLTAPVAVGAAVSGSGESAGSVSPVDGARGRRRGGRPGRSEQLALLPVVER